MPVSLGGSVRGASGGRVAGGKDSTTCVAALTLNGNFIIIIDSTATKVSSKNHVLAFNTLIVLVCQLKRCRLTQNTKYRRCIILSEIKYYVVWFDC